MSETSLNRWRAPCLAAETETDTDKLADLIADAKMAMTARRRELDAERQSLNEAVRRLRELEVARLGFQRVVDKHVG